MIRRRARTFRRLAGVFVRKFQRYFVHSPFPIGSFFPRNTSLPMEQIRRAVPLGDGFCEKSNRMVLSPGFPFFLEASQCYSGTHIDGSFVSIKGRPAGVRVLLIVAANIARNSSKARSRLENSYVIVFVEAARVGSPWGFSNVLLVTRSHGTIVYRYHSEEYPKEC
jgi:hypothetical protein